MVRSLHHLKFSPRFVRLALVHTLGCACLFGQSATVTVDTTTTVLESRMSIGLSHTGQEWIHSSDEAGKTLMRQLLVDGGVSFQNVHLMGWGAGNPQPVEGGPYDWGGLDLRVDAMRAMNAEMIMTLCTAPGWMKTSGEDWSMNDKVAPEHYQDFADLCVAAANRYPDIQYFQIWNELKGWWMSDIEGFTVFYNVVYDALRAARPDAIICGPYMNGLSEDLKNNGTMRQVTHDAFDHFLANMNGADVINYDGWLTGYPPENSTLTQDQLMANTACFGNFTAALQEKTPLPIWISEFYAAQEENSSNEAFLVANHASAYLHSLVNGTELVMHWGAFSHVPWFVDLEDAGGQGGSARPHYDVVAAFNNHFGPGTQIMESSSADPWIEVLASPVKTMLINKADAAYTVTVNGIAESLAAYEVKVIDTPDYQLPNTGTVEVDLGTAWGPATQRGSGMLWGLSADEPSDAYIDPLKFKVYRGRLTPWIPDSGIQSMQRMSGKGARIQAVLSDEYNLDERSAGKKNGVTHYTNPDDYDPSGDFAYHAIEIWPGDILPESSVAGLLPPDLPSEYRVDVEGVPHIDMTFIWDEVVENAYNQIVAAGLDVEWDFWEEPNWKGWFGPMGDDETGNRDRYFEVYKRTYDKLKALDPNATIVGPGPNKYDHDWLTAFLLYADANNVMPDHLSWHELDEVAWGGSPEDVAKHTARMRNFMGQNGLQVDKIDINEVVSEDRQFNPGMHVWYFTYMEKAEIDGACRTVWFEDSGAFNGWEAMLGGLLTRPPNSEPRSTWWTYKAYADITGTLVDVQQDATMAGLAGVDAGDGKLRILLGKSGNNTGNSQYSVVVKNLSQYPWLMNNGVVRVEAHKIPSNGTDALLQPVDHFDLFFAVENDQITIPISNFVEEEAMTLELSAAPSTITRSVQIDFGNGNSIPVAGGTWNEFATASGTNALVSSSGDSTAVTIGSWSNFQDGSQNEAGGYDYSATEWGESAQDYFQTTGAVTGSFTLSGFDAGDQVEIQLIAVEYNIRRIEFRIDGASPSTGSSYHSRNDGHRDGTVAVWSGLTGQNSYDFSAYCTNNNRRAVVSAMRIMVIAVDTDGDGLADSEEAAWGTLPENPDTDGDGLPDGKEVNEAGSDPTLASSYGNGMDDLMAYALGAGTFATPIEALPTFSGVTGAMDLQIPWTLAADIDYTVEVSSDLGSWYRIAHKLAGSGWQKDVTDDSTPVFPGIVSIDVVPAGDGVAITDSAQRSQLFVRLLTDFVNP